MPLIVGSGSELGVASGAIESAQSAESEQQSFEMALNERDSTVNPSNAVSVRAGQDGDGNIGDPGTGGGATGEDSELQEKLMTMIITVMIQQVSKFVMKNLNMVQAIARNMQHSLRGDNPADHESIFKQILKPTV